MARISFINKNISYLPQQTFLYTLEICINREKGSRYYTQLFENCVALYGVYSEAVKHFA